MIGWRGRYGDSRTAIGKRRRTTSRDEDIKAFAVRSRLGCPPSTSDNASAAIGYAMLRTITLPTFRISSAHTVVTCRLAAQCAAARTLTTTSPRLAPVLESKPLDAKAVKGVEGLHRKDVVTHEKEMLTTPDAVSTIPSTFKGDWVLFHPVYTSEELRAVKVMHKNADTFSDKIALVLVKTARKCFDITSRYKHKEIPSGSNMTVEELQKKGYILTEQQWLNRILFLESIAGVPGMVAATLRHLRSLRMMKRDSGWIHTLLEEAENERMHLMTFMAVRKPSLWFRALVLGAQGVFYNMFFLAYILSPRACHRFVGYLEEEAVRTYTHCISEMEAGHVPAWENVPAPAIAKDYWRLQEDAKLLDVIYAVRSDETTHRFVNHSLANLNHQTDINPFALREPDMHVKGAKIDFERDEAEKYVEESHRILTKKSHDFQ